MRIWQTPPNMWLKLFYKCLKYVSKWTSARQAFVRKCYISFRFWDCASYMWEVGLHPWTCENLPDTPKHVRSCQTPLKHVIATLLKMFEFIEINISQATRSWQTNPKHVIIWQTNHKHARICQISLNMCCTYSFILHGNIW